MNSLERIQEQEEAPVSLEESSGEIIESLEKTAGIEELSLVTKGLSTERELMALAHKEGAGETFAFLMQEARAAREETRRYREELRLLRASTALPLVLAAQESGATTPSILSPEVLAAHAERTRTLLEGVEASVRRRESEFPDKEPELRTVREETSAVLMKLQNPEENRYGKLSLKIAEVAARALASAAGLGLGVAGYDIAKEIFKTYRTRA